MSRDSQDLLESVEIFDVCELESELPCFCWVMGPIQCESGPIQCWGGYSVIDIGLDALGDPALLLQFRI